MNDIVQIGLTLAEQLRKQKAEELEDQDVKLTEEELLEHRFLFIFQRGNNAISQRFESSMSRIQSHRYRTLSFQRITHLGDTFLRLVPVDEFSALDASARFKNWIEELFAMSTECLYGPTTRWDLVIMTPAFTDLADNPAIEKNLVCHAFDEAMYKFAYDSWARFPELANA